VDHVLEPGQPSETRECECEYDFTFNSEQTEVVHRVARELSTTAYFVLVAAYARALSIAARQPEVAIVSMSHGRDDTAIIAIVGSMQSQLLLRIAQAQGQPFKTLVRECQRVHGEAHDFYFPFGPICHQIPGAPPQTAYPEFNYSTSIVPAARNSPPAMAHSAHGGFRDRMKPIKVPDPNGSATRASEFPGIKLNLHAGDSTIRGRIVYLASEYEPSTIARFAELIASIEPAEQRFAAG
jgi:hypothetical protein